MIEFWIENVLIETMFGLTSLLGAILLGWANLRIEPPLAAGMIKAELSVWERHQLRQSLLEEKEMRSKGREGEG